LQPFFHVQTTRLQPSALFAILLQCAKITTMLRTEINQILCPQASDWCPGTITSNFAI